MKRRNFLLATLAAPLAVKATESPKPKLSGIKDHGDYYVIDCEFPGGEISALSEISPTRPYSSLRQAHEMGMYSKPQEVIDFQQAARKKLLADWKARNIT